MFKHAFLILAIPLLGALSAAPVAAQTELPPDQLVQMSIHSDPNDPDSPVRFQLTLHLAAESADGSAVDWHVNWIEVDHLDPYGVAIESWYELDPEVNTETGAWKVTHANPLAPTVEEFSVPPEIQGFATSKAIAGDGLQYHLAGQVAQSEAVKPYGVTVFADYLFWKASEAEPLDEGSDTPVEGEAGNGSLG